MPGLGSGGLNAAPIGLAPLDATTSTDSAILYSPGGHGLNADPVGAAPLGQEATPGLPQPPPPPPPPPPSPPFAFPSVRERDIRAAIKDALVATGSIEEDNVQILPINDTMSVPGPNIALIEPMSTGLEASGGMTAGAGTSRRTALGFDAPSAGPLLFTSLTQVTILSGEPNPTVRDAAIEWILYNLCNAVNGRSLADVTFPADTLVTTWKWQPMSDKNPRAVIATVRCVFLIDGWEGFDTSP